MSPPALALYRAATGLLEPLAPALLRRRARRGKEDPQRLGERLGRGRLSRPPGPLAWLHGASVGESLSILPLLEALRARRPDATLLVTSGTRTSAALLAERLPPGALHQFAPVDAPSAARAFVGHWRPDLAVFVESELWPNLILEATEAGAKAALVSARLSAASLKGWARAPRSAAALLSRFDLVMAQDDATARGLSALGARDDGRLNLKLAAAPPPVDAAALAEARAAAAGEPVFLAASTHPGEEAIVLDAFARLKLGRLILAPRHPERGREVAALAEAQGFAAGLRSAGAAFGPEPVYVADTLGELGLWYSTADASLVGGSLVPGPGGHNPLEPARLGRPFVSGLHVDNWRAVYMRLDGAVSYVADANSLAMIWEIMIGSPAAQARAERAREIALQEADESKAAADRLAALLPGAAP